MILAGLAAQGQGRRVACFFHLESAFGGKFLFSFFSGLSSNTWFVSHAYSVHQDESKQTLLSNCPVPTSMCEYRTPWLSCGICYA